MDYRGVANVVQAAMEKLQIPDEEDGDDHPSPG